MRTGRVLCAIMAGCLILSSCADTGSASMPEWELSTEKGSRDNTPVCLVPEAPGKEVLENDVVRVDVSNKDEGYIIARYNGDNPKVKLQITLINTEEEEVTYTYNMKVDGGADEVFPLSMGDGTYNIAVFENIRATQYAAAFSEDIDVELRDGFLPFLYPNQYVDFRETDETVAMAKELAYPANSDLDVISNVYNYIIRNVTYDVEEAETVQSGYLPDVDEVLETGKGICFDYAALMCAMLRSQQIPTRMELGYAGTAYHAWISCHIDGIGWINGVIEFDGVDWKLMDPTFAASTSEKELKQFIGDGENYELKYIY